MQPDAAIARIAARQHGAFSTSQALEAGFTQSAIRHRDRSGRWTRLHHGVYVIAGAPDTPDRRVIAAVLAYGPPAAASFTTAAELHGIVEGRRTIIHVTLPHAHHREPRKGVRTHQAGLRRNDVVMVDGVRTTSPHRTLVDLAGILSRRPLEAALDTAILSGLVSIASLQRYIRSRKLKNKRGMGVLRRALRDRLTGVPESYLERLFLEQAEEAGMELPTRQYRAARKRIDLVYLDEGIAIELDGRVAHSSAEDFQNDRTRQNEIVVVDGLLPLRFTRADVQERWPYVQRSVEALLARHRSA